MNQQQSNKRRTREEQEVLATPLLAEFVNSEAQAGWTPEDACEAFSDYFGVRSGRGQRLLAAEIDGLSRDGRRAMAYLGSLIDGNGAGWLPDTSQLLLQTMQTIAVEVLAM